MLDNLQIIREQLFDAPIDIKHDFNTVVNYFSTPMDNRSANKVESLYKAALEESNKIDAELDKYLGEDKPDPKKVTELQYKSFMAEHWKNYLYNVYQTKKRFERKLK